ncbi:MAG: baseplate J/gp47 family protein [Chloroflexi bacterium]|nr:baseplate J/gp47 family protein [Chloroflexota bacterium]
MRSSSPAASQELIFLDPDDDLATVRAKLESTAADEIYLVIPRNASILRIPLEFRILGRLASELSSETIIVSQDSHRRYLAHQEGFRTKSSLRQLRHLMAPGARPNPLWALVDWIPLPSLRLAILALALAAAGAGFAVFVLPEMRVTLTPKVDTLGRDVDITVDANALRVDPSRRIVPGRKAEQRLEVRGAVPASGSARAGKTKAIGEALLFNNRKEDVKLPKGTVVMTEDGVRFSIEREVTVPARTTRDGVLAEMLAVEPGARGNVPSRAITRFEDAQWAGLEVINRLPTSAGTDREVRAVADKDLGKLRDQLLQQARDEASIAMQGALGNDVVIPDDAIRLTVAEERFDQDVGAVAEQLTGQIVVNATALGFKRDDLAKVVNQVIASQLDSQLQMLGGQPALGQIKFVSSDGSAVKLRVHADAVVARSVDRTSVQEALRGKSPEEARAILAGLQGLASSPKLELSPQWATRAFRVSVEVAAPR